MNRPPLRIVRPDEQPRRFVTRGFLVAAAVVLLILALLGWVIFGRSQPPRSPAPKTGAPPPAVATPAPRVTSSQCRLSNADQTVPTSAPVVQWDLFDTVALPYSLGSGPEFVAGDIARCYAHTPTGSLLADIQVAARYVIAADWRKVLATQVVPGPGRKAYAAERAEVSGPDTPGEFCQIAGFSMLNYTPAASHIEIVSRCGSNLQAETTTVEWSGTDWRLVLTANGSVAPAATHIANITGFVPFGGV